MRETDVFVKAFKNEADKLLDNYDKMQLALVDTIHILRELNVDKGVRRKVRDMLYNKYGLVIMSDLDDIGLHSNGAKV